jgi:RNA polymerase sigma factor (sigma-70 family)
LQKKEAEKRFESLIKGHELLIHKVCRMYAKGSAERQDLFQDIVVQLWTSFSRFKGNSKFSTWLYRVASTLQSPACVNEKILLTNENSVIWNSKKEWQQSDHRQPSINKNIMDILLLSGSVLTLSFSSCKFS